MHLARHYWPPSLWTYTAALPNNLLHTQVPPEYLIVENVVGFEHSRTRDAMQNLMQTAGYAMQARLGAWNCNSDTC